MHMVRFLARVAIFLPTCREAAAPVTTSPEPLPTQTAASVARPAPHAACDNDAPPSFDCATLHLGDCSAGVYYACPAAKLPPGTGFRSAVASRIAECLAAPGYDGHIEACVKPLETCVRKAVAQACIDDDALATCKQELSTCSEDLQQLCAKLLSSLEPKTRASALRDMRSQRTMAGKASCSFDWDLNGFPFCPYCPFKP